MGEQDEAEKKALGKQEIHAFQGQNPLETTGAYTAPDLP